MSSLKPYVLICATPIYGHFMPFRAIAKYLVCRGYDVSFIGSPGHRQLLEETGARFVPLSGYAAYDDIDVRWPERRNVPPGPARLGWGLREIFCKSIPSQFETIQGALREFQAENPFRPVIVLNESAFLGATPMKLGAKGLLPTGIIAAGIIPLVLSSIDLPPLGLGLPPDSTPEGRVRNQVLTRQIYEGAFGEVKDLYDGLLQDLGAQPCPYYFLDASVRLPDIFPQMTIPSAEFPRSDAPTNLRFAGSLPSGSRDGWSDPPDWWQEVVENLEKKHVVIVSQGSLTNDFSQLIIPTMIALADLPNVLVVVALGWKGARLPVGTPVPANTRVADFVPFDEVFPLVDVFVTNGGYGGFNHAISHGLPLVIAGVSEDKPDVAARAVWAGVGISLNTGTPTPKQVKVAIEEIFSNPKYHKRARELQVEANNHDPFRVIAESIDELAFKGVS